MPVAEEIGAFVVDKITTLLWDKGKECYKGKQFDNSLNKLKDSLNQMTIIEANGWGSLFYDYIDNYKIIEKIIYNYLDADISNNTKITDEITNECIVYIQKNKNDSVSFDPKNETEVEDTIEKLNSNVLNFCKGLMTKEQIVQINLLSQNVSNNLDKQTKQITADTLEIIKKVNEIIKQLNKDVIAFEVLSWATKKSYVDKFKKNGVFEDVIDFDKKMSVEEMYIKPSLKLYSNDIVESKYTNKIDVSVDKLIEAFASHTDEKSFIEKLETEPENKTIINEIFSCFESNGYEYNKTEELYKKILFIYGDAGTGKSMFVSNKCVQNLNDENVYVLEMKEISVDKGEIIYNNKKIEINDIKDNSQLYLDGFDESVHNNEIIEIIQKKIKEQRVRNFKIIVTSRIDYNVSESLKKHTMYTKLNFLKGDEIYEYIDRYFKNYKLEESKNYELFKSHLEKAIQIDNDDEEKNAKTFNMYKIPILLYMFSNNVVRETTKNSDYNYDFANENRYTLYKGIFGENGYIYKDKGSVLKDTRETLKNISLEMFRQNQLDVEPDMDLLKAKLNANINSNNKVGAGEFYLKVERLKFEFYHKSFYEYFVAEKMADKIVDLIINFNENEDVEQFLNIFFGFNYITDDIYYFLTEIIKDKYKESKRGDLDIERYKFFEDEINDKNKFITFFRKFVVNLCMPKSFDGKYNISRSNADEIMVNTFFNITTILLRILSESKEYKSKKIKGINVLGINKESDIYINKSIRSLFLLNTKNNIDRFFNDFSIGKDGYDFSQVGFNGMRLSNNYFVAVNFNDSILNFTDLSGADLSGADLSCTSLVDTNLIDIDLIATDLRYADLTRANLDGANLRSAILDGTDLYDANLSNVTIYDIDIKNWPLTEKEIKARGVSIVITN